MGHRNHVLFLTLAAAIASATGTAAQAPPASDEVVVPPTKGHPSVGKSDKHRVVGKVLGVDRTRGLVKLATEDQGVVEVPAPPMTLGAVRVGEIVSVPREAGSYPSASPR